MTERANTRFRITAWTETPYDDLDGTAKLTRARVTTVYEGEIEGEGTLEYLMVYPGEGAASYVGHERVVGTFAGRRGSFVLRHVGTVEADGPAHDLTVVPGSATGELLGLRAASRFASATEKSHPMVFDYELPSRGQAARQG